MCDYAAVRGKIAPSWVGGVGKKDSDFAQTTPFFWQLKQPVRLATHNPQPTTYKPTPAQSLREQCRIAQTNTSP
jgi:hypothetical protein